MLACMTGVDENGRDQERVKVEAFVKVSNTDGDHEYVFRTRDLSSSGLFLYTRVAHIYPFKVGSTLALELYDYDEFLVCTVVVVRVVESGSAEADRYPTGFGVRITQLDDLNRGRLATMINRVKAGGELY
jgi:hypothetical protein